MAGRMRTGRKRLGPEMEAQGTRSLPHVLVKPQLRCCMSTGTEVLALFPQVSVFLFGKWGLCYAFHGVVLKLENAFERYSLAYKRHLLLLFKNLIAFTFKNNSHMI